MLRKKALAYCFVMVFVFLGCLPNAMAEIPELTIARQFGIGYIQFMVMEHYHLVKKHAAAMGIKHLVVHWLQISGGSTVSDGLLSGNLDFAASGVPPLITLWAKTKGTLNVKGVSSMCSFPIYLNTRNPDVRTIQDLTEKDRIAVPSVKVSTQARTLQMAAAKVFGQENYDKLDVLTVSMKHPDALAAMLSGKGLIDSDFTNQPYAYLELKDPHIHTVINSFQIYGGPATANVAITTERVVKSKPKLYRAFVAALKDATAIINADKKAAAKLYIQASGNKHLTVEDTATIIMAPDFIFTMTPENMMQMADFMYKVGAIERKPYSWKDLFFSNVHNLPGS